MSYSQQEWVDNDLTKPLSAARMAHLEAGLGAISDSVDQKATINSVSGFAAADATHTADIAANTAAIATKVTQGSLLVSVLDYGAVGDGVADDTAAIQAALDTNREVYVPVGVYKISSTLNVHAGCTLRGAGSGNYGQGAASPYITDIRITSNTATTGIIVASRGNISDLCIRPANYAAVNYQMAIYPADTGNAAVGINVGDSGGSGRAERLYVEGFSQYGILANSVSRVSSCFVRNCPTGIYLDGSDGSVESCAVMFCQTVGIELHGAFWKILGCRLEWNARYGITGSAEATYVGNLFDRNGWAGLYLPSGLWGQVITGNYFCRNGAGGNGLLGRWAASDLAHSSYVVTTAAQSCHIQIDYQRGVTITGNRYRSGQDDTGNGANSPCYIYSSSASSGASDSDSNTYMSNAGERGGSGSGLGYLPTEYGNTATLGAIAGGTDATLASLLNNRFVSRTAGVNTLGPITTADLVTAVATVPNRAASASVSTLNINVIKLNAAGANTGRCGRILLKATTSSVACVSEIYFAANSSGTGLLVTYTNIIGAAISSATIASYDATYNRIVVTLGASYFCNYALEYAN